MPRPPRIIVPEQPVHIVQRGVNRCVTFVTRADYTLFLMLLRELSDLHGCAIHSWTLMTNHFHLLLTPRDEIGPSRLLKALGGRYVPHFNRCQGRTGTLWQGRFFSSNIGSDNHFMACSRYVERNADRAGLVRNLADYEWTSYHCNALGKHDPLVTPHPLMRALARTDQGRHDAYRELFEHPVDEDFEASIRHAWRTSRPLDAVIWKDQVVAALNQRRAVA